MMVSDPMPSVPTNTAVTQPFAAGQPNRVTPPAKVTGGGVAKVASAAVGN